MQALRLTRPRVPLRRHVARCLATTANTVHPVSSSSSASSSVIPLSNVEAQWAKMSSDEQLLVHQQLEELQEKDWKQLSVDEKKAAYYIAFGPHGPRAPTDAPGAGIKIFLGTLSLVGTAGLLFYAIKSISPPPPKTLTKEWEEASNERAREAKINPISGISSEGYTGKGFVQSK